MVWDFIRFTHKTISHVLILLLMEYGLGRFIDACYEMIIKLS